MHWLCINVECSDTRNNRIPVFHIQLLNIKTLNIQIQTRIHTTFISFYTIYHSSFKLVFTQSKPSLYLPVIRLPPIPSFQKRIKRNKVLSNCLSFKFQRFRDQNISVCGALNSFIAILFLNASANYNFLPNFCAPITKHSVHPYHPIFIFSQLKSTIFFKYIQPICSRCQFKH